MKKITPNDLLILIVILLIFITTGFFAKGTDTSSCLEISGKILKIKTTVSNSYFVALICDDAVIDFKIIKGNNEFKFNLKKNGLYTVRITKEGYQAKFVNIDTKLATKHEGSYKLHFDTELIEDAEAIKFNVKPLAVPIALISFDPNKRWFNYNTIYTRKEKKIFYADNHNRN